MINKQGITVTILVITIIVLTILAGTITVSTLSTINYSKLSSWVNEITYIQDVVDEENNKSSNMDYTMGDVVLSISQSAYNGQFEGENINEDNTLTLRMLDLGKLKITNTTYGNLETKTDVYAVSVQTGRVYYVQGIENDGEIYYSLTDILKQRFNLTNPENKLSSIVFIPSVIGYSNNPITVLVKIPSICTGISITTSNDKIQIGTQTIKENTYEYIVNTNNEIGNYTITVSYNIGGQNLASEYEVNGYDKTPPIIQPLDYYNIVYKENGNEKTEYIRNVTASDESGIKVIKYEIGTISEQDAQTYFKNSGNVILNEKINLNRNITIYTIYAEDNAGNYSILTFDKKYIMPENWKENVSYIQSTIPIPKGFVASPYDGENTKNGGMVIYELNEGETEIPVNETQFKSQTTRNQYVWTPVDDFSKFVRHDFINSKVADEEGNYYPLGSVDLYWEVIVNANNIPLQEQLETYMSETTLAEVQAMYKSVKEYKGFYIGRYEAGIDTQRTNRTEPLINGKNVYSRMGKIPYTYINWSTMATMSVDTGGAVEVARGVYSNDNSINTTGVISTLTYGVQWDTTLQWYIDVGLLAWLDIRKDCTKFGNYSNHKINSKEELNRDALVWDYSADNTGTYVEKNSATLIYPKNSGTQWCLSTGALKAAKVNNVYDMAGNVYEWTMEGVSTKYRVYRGGYFSVPGSSAPLAYRTVGSLNNGFGYMCGFRISLYIKNT